MPNRWKKKIVEQGYNYLDGPIHSMVEFFETRIENLEKYKNNSENMSVLWNYYVVPQGT